MPQATDGAGCSAQCAGPCPGFGCGPLNFFVVVISLILGNILGGGDST